MADAAVEFLLENLQQLLNNQIHLIKGAKEQVETLERDLRLFKAFLKDSTKKRRKDEGLQELVRQIRDVVYEAEDVVDVFVTQAAETKSKGYFRRALKKPVQLRDIAKQVEAVGKQVRDIYGDRSKLDFASLSVADGGPEELEAPLIRQENVVGFDGEANTIIGYLKEETQQLDVISIVGMPGLGKTTLAGKIFHDPNIKYEFPTHIWVYVSQEFTKKNVFLAILSEFTKLTEDMYRKSDQELARLVADKLETGKFLLVLDDVWTAEDWEKLRTALPMNNKMGKVLITSRHKEMACCANRLRPPHQLKFLTQDESWLLLQLEVFGKADQCPQDLEVLGKLIAKQCGGLPLAIVVIGGILVKKFSTSDVMTAKKSAWEKVSNSVSTYLNEDPQRRMEKIIALSYDKLPYHVRACFLYLGMFPEDYEIPVWKLIRMWIAEGFIQKKIGISLEDTAESYLEDLINRNLVRVDKRRPDGRVKTCRIHDMLRDFCKMEAGNERENFLQEIKKSTSDGDFEPSVSDVEKFRRLCIHSNVLSFICSKPYGPHVRSFACFSKEELTLPTENVSAIPAAFKLLRVLDVKPIKFSKIPSDMYHLVHLRYIALSFTLDILPPAFSKLWNIQTLILDTTSRTLEIKADIWKMVQLRHLKANASTTLPKTGNSKEGEKLQTLGTISPQSCTEEVLDRAHNLKKLGIRGRLASLLDGKIGAFDSVRKLENLEKLKLLNDVFPDPASDGKLRGLPPAYKFPPKLKSLTLSDTFLSWAHMSILGSLENLEVLKLKEKAFVGPSWEVADVGFRHLEVLHIGRTNLNFWVASVHHFPRLRRLELHNCEELHEIPFPLADVPSFQLLDLYRSKAASASAKKIRDEKQKKEGESGFKLTIFPPDE